MDRNDVLAALYRAAVERNDPGEVQRLEAAIEGEPVAPPEFYYARPYALWYAEQGWPVFPLQEHSKQPISGSHGLHDATTNVGQVKVMFHFRPSSNIGIATGHKHDVVDIDGLDGMTTMVDKLRENAEYIGVPILAISTTPRGLHLWVAATGRGNSAAILPGIDFRGRGGYVVAPPSRLYAGTEQSFLSSEVTQVYEHYQWLMPPRGDA